MPRHNQEATDLRNAYRERPYYGGRPEPGWMSAGFARTRDSDPLEISNHEIARAILESAGCDVTVDRFNHWAVGWVDYLTVRITRESVAEVAELLRRIEIYPVLDDDDYVEREWNEDHPADGRCYSRSLEDYGEPCPCGLPRWGEEA